MQRLGWWVWGIGLVVGVGYAMLPGSWADRFWRAGAGGHAAGFGALTVAGIWVAEWRRGWMVAAGTFGLGVGIELAQRFVPGRGFEWPDVAADAVGVGAGWAVGAAWGWMIRRRAAEKGAAGAAGLR